MIASIIWIGRDPGGANITDAANSLSSTGNIDRNALAFFSHFTWSMTFAVGWCLLRWRGIVTHRIGWFAVPTTLWLLADAGRRGQLWLGIAVGIGICALAEALVEAAESRDAHQMALAIWLLVALPLLVYIHLAPKYLVASAPAAALLLARATNRGPRRWAIPVGIFVGAAGLVLGLLIVRADARLAGVERRAARTQIAPRVARGERVWFSGHWGFQWYAERAGARPLTRGRRVAAPGDVVLVDEQAHNQGLIDAYPNRELIDVVADASPGGRIMNQTAGAGFYSNTWGDLPWVWSRTTEVNRISVWRIR